MSQNELHVERKNRRKVRRTILQIFLLLVVAVILAFTLFDIKKYEEPSKEHWDNREGFITLSYFGIDRTGSPKLLPKKELRKQLTLLKAAGYETISQQDLLNFYNKGTPLPKKALFLTFEDGRNDSGLFANPILKQLNYRATMLSYANRMGEKDHKFLQPKDLKRMEKTGYWELGTNGYRLTYINIFDEDGRFIGLKDEKEIPNKLPIEYYNHYLMDFIRDKNMIPAEHRKEMDERITKDYELMDQVYRKELGKLPQLYMIMHSNSMYNSMNPLVQEVNEREIKQAFAMHFNLDRYAYNDEKADLYNLTRLQVAPFWSTNHFIMEVNETGRATIPYETGNRERAEKWKVEKGAAEFLNNQLILTSPRGGTGKITYSLPAEATDYNIKTRLLGNIVGQQSIVLTDGNQKVQMRITIENNTLQLWKVDQKDSQLIEKYPLPEVKWKEEDYAFSKARVYSKQETLEGSRVDELEYPVTVRGDRKVEIQVVNRQVTVFVDGERYTNEYTLPKELAKPLIQLQAAPYEKKTEGEQHAEATIYDAIFENLVIASEEKQRKVYVTTESTGWEKTWNKMKAFWDEILTKVMETF